MRGRARYRALPRRVGAASSHNVRERAMMTSGIGRAAGMAFSVGAAALLGSAACAADPAARYLSPQREGWKLVWADEFDAGAAPDTGRWVYERGYLRNNEAQYYTVERPENARIENGRLVLEARAEVIPVDAGARGTKEGDVTKYTSASISSKESWTYGRYEVLAKVPTGVGVWPAIWMLSPTFREHGWPKCGEIDIMEHVGYEPGRIHGTVHTGAFNHVIGTQKGKFIDLNTPGEMPHEAFHLYAVEWTPEQIDFYVDETKYLTFKKEGDTRDVWPFDDAFYFKLNIAIGGGWGGQKGIDDNVFPHRMEIEYARVYQRAE